MKKITSLAFFLAVGIYSAAIADAEPTYLIEAFKKNPLEIDMELLRKGLEEGKI